MITSFYRYHTILAAQHLFILLLQPNGHDHGSEAVEEQMLAAAKDYIQVGLAANLRDFVLTNCEGTEVKGSEVFTYDGTPVAYALCPTETVSLLFMIIFFF
ncbi:hypothetical protein JRO89_XS14G0022500 [Xanthoceras sorbifolium]|uniref:Uncharacterized protein n=1 Tax=Xanthoceras sorbifolium TaxID=99658 RepID=A0ABQ8H3D7_9ROSI|nr:hypothetical protein JRO89_XS14G0022500 [Xanthoceras sorbifolium]